MLIVLVSHAIYEQNFRRMMRLLPEFESCPEGGGWETAAGARLLLGCGLSVEVMERHKYTTVLKLAYDMPCADHLTSPVMLVRVCHDARVAEVLSYQEAVNFFPKYEYPNPAMRQVREKSRLNEFLGEWLDYFLKREASLLVVQE